jgi:hypothetical protein
MMHPHLQHLRLVCGDGGAGTDTALETADIAFESDLICKDCLFKLKTPKDH